MAPIFFFNFFFFFSFLSFNANAASQLPPYLKTYDSPLTATQTKLYAAIAANDPKLFSQQLPGICKKANLLCYPPEDMKSYSLNKVKYEDPPPPITDPLMSSISSIPTPATTDPPTVRLFMKEEMLKTGNVMKLNKILSDWPKRSFLPQEIESKIPFSISKLGEIQAFFNITTNDALFKMISKTLSICETNVSTSIHECIKSNDGLIGFATRVLGKNILGHITNNSLGFDDQIVKLGKVTILGGRTNNPIFAICHQVPYPYMVYLCHKVPKVRVYKTNFLDSDDQIINEAYVVCHLDTSSWDSSHEAFKELGEGPGKIHICHWMDTTDIVWSATPN